MLFVGRTESTVRVFGGVVDTQSPSTSERVSQVTAAMQSSRTDVLLLKKDTE